MSNSYGTALRLTIFGQSHGPAIGMTLEGLPAGFAPNTEALQSFLNRRAPGQGTPARSCFRCRCSLGPKLSAGLGWQPSRTSPQSPPRSGSWISHPYRLLILNLGMKHPAEPPAFPAREGCELSLE